jgi:ring-1,2-phenylacetyl-CoA epoxidase subunit PaaB
MHDAATTTAAPATPSDAVGDSQWTIWEVFTQEGQGAPHEHAGSLHAVDAEHALQNARDVYARRGKVVSLWVVPTAAITASSPGDAGPTLRLSSVSCPLSPGPSALKFSEFSRAKLAASSESWCIGPPSLNLSSQPLATIIRSVSGSQPCRSE